MLIASYAKKNDYETSVTYIVLYIHCTFLVLGVSLKIVQLLQHFEHLVQPLAQAVETFVNEFSVKSVVSEVIR